MTTDLVSIALHESYTTSDNFIIGDGTSLSIANIGSFTLPSLPTPLLFTNVLHVLAISKNLISIPALCVDNPVNVLFFTLSFKCKIDRHSGVTLVHRQLRGGVYYWPKSIPLSVFHLSSAFFSSVLVFCYFHVA